MNKQKWFSKQIFFSVFEKMKKIFKIKWRIFSEKGKITSRIYGFWKYFSKNH